MAEENQLKRLEAAIGNLNEQLDRLWGRVRKMEGEAKTDTHTIKMLVDGYVSISKHMVTELAGLAIAFSDLSEEQVAQIAKDKRNQPAPTV